MQNFIDKNSERVLSFLAGRERGAHARGPDIAEGTRLTPEEVNDAVAQLVDAGYAKWTRFFGTAPFNFGIVQLTSRGQYAYERARRTEQAPSARISVRPPYDPVGSPFGFKPGDWRIVRERKSAQDQLQVVLGYQFNSKHYDSQALVANVKRMFQKAIRDYNAMPDALPASLHFHPLAAGYGGHLFNRIARDIIGSDIAVFETSDLNPNVMLEMGVALTWGVAVLPIKREGRRKPPSDISGQTWADYRDSAAAFVDSNHHSRLVSLVEEAVRGKGP